MASFAPRRTDSIDDYVKELRIGRGACGSIHRVRHKQSGNIFAIKEMNKSVVERDNLEHTVTAERAALVHIKQSGQHSPYVINLICAFTDDTSLYFVLDYMSHGELRSVLGQIGPLTEQLTRHWAAELVLGLEFLRLRGIVHRDIKPENILLDETFRCKITDFGSSHIFENNQAVAMNVYCGTPTYMSPEVINSPTPVTFASDLWALGCIIYEFHVGEMCFKREPRDTLGFRIKKCQHGAWPENALPHIVDLVGNLLRILPGQRLGMSSRDYTELRAHPFFRWVDWDMMPEVRPPMPRLGWALSGGQGELQGLDSDSDTQEQLETDFADLRIDPEDAPLPIAWDHFGSPQRRTGSITMADIAPTRSPDRLLAHTPPMHDQAAMDEGDEPYRPPPRYRVIGKLDNPLQLPPCRACGFYQNQCTCPIIYDYSKNY